MFIKSCESCGKEIEAKLKSKRFCSRSCLLKEYFSDSNKREARREYNKKYMDNLENNKRFKEWRKNYRKRPDIKEKIRILAVTKYKERIREYDKEYRKRPEIKSRINTKERMRRKTDMKFAIINRLRRSLNHALTKYSKTGKIMGSKKYGINWGKVIKGLKPFPVSVKKYEIDHIKPLHSFNLDNRKEIKKTFDPSNLQWLTIEENRVKSGKIIESSGGNRKFPTNA